MPSPPGRGGGAKSNGQPSPAVAQEKGGARAAVRPAQSCPIACISNDVWPSKNYPDCGKKQCPMQSNGRSHWRNLRHGHQRQASKLPCVRRGPTPNLAQEDKEGKSHRHGPPTTQPSVRGMGAAVSSRQLGLLTPRNARAHSCGATDAQGHRRQNRTNEGASARQAPRNPGRASAKSKGSMDRCACRRWAM